MVECPLGIEPYVRRSREMEADRSDVGQQSCPLPFIEPPPRGLLPRVSSFRWPPKDRAKREPQIASAMRRFVVDDSERLSAAAVRSLPGAGHTVDGVYGDGR